MARQAWIESFPGRSLVFEPLARFGRLLRGDRWPTLAELQRLVDEIRVVNRRGMPLRQVPQGPRPASPLDGYEPRIYLRGELQVRDAEWHDLFNVLAWLVFPRAKAALNARHYRALVAQAASGARNRGPAQDALTLFDEGGVIVASSDRGLLRMLVDFAWKDLFWRDRTRVAAHMEFFVFGHALFEKVLDPYVGITGRAVLFEVGTDFHGASTAARVARLDALLADRLDDETAFRATRELTPVPILGVPGWYAQNAAGSFYDNADYFRPRRTGGNKDQSPA